MQVNLDSVIARIERSPWWAMSFVLDYMICLGIIGTCQLWVMFATPYCRVHFENDMSTALPFQEAEIVPMWLLVLISGGLPLVVFGAYQMIQGVVCWHDFHNATLSLLESVSLVQLLTNSAKLYSARYRPDWDERVKHLGLTGHNAPFLCQVAALKEGRLSFPSGHASTAFATMSVLALYLAGKIGMFHRRGGQMHKALVVIAPLYVAGWVAISRTRDYRHNFDDILAGACIGVFAGAFSYYMNYPSLYARNCQLPLNRKAEDVDQMDLVQDKDPRHSQESLDSVDSL